MSKYTNIPAIDAKEKMSLSNELTPKYDFKNIRAEDIKADAEKLSKPVSESKIPPFPVEVFPLAIQEIIKTTNESLNYPTDFIGASMLYAASLAIGNTHRIEGKISWSETAVLYLALVGRPNTNKSHPLSFALRLFFEKDKITYYEYEKKCKEFEQAVTLTKKERKAQNIPIPAKPVWQKFIVQDFTPEALNEVHKFNKRGIGVYVDEFAGWFKNFNRYHKGAEQEFWLSNWNSKEIYIDRKSGNIFIPFPFISVAGTIQTGILSELAKDNRSQNGQIDRILFAFPQGLEKPDWSEKEINPVIISNWKAIIENLLSLKLELDTETFNPVPTILKFNDEAQQIFIEWYNSNANLCRATENDALASIYGKFDIHVFRFALILEMLRYACDESDKQAIGIEAMNGALRLAEYFMATAVKVNSIISNSSPLDNLPADKRKLYDALPDVFTTAEGLEVAGLHAIPADTFHKWLRRNTKILFEKSRMGKYEKLI